MTENKDTVISFRKKVLRGSRSAPDDLATEGRETSTSAARRVGDSRLIQQTAERAPGYGELSSLRDSGPDRRFAPLGRFRSGCTPRAFWSGGCTAASRRGTGDRIHGLVGLKPTHRVSDFLCEFRVSISMWVQRDVGLSKFQWQPGYGAFSVSASQIEVVSKYIDRRREHHRHQGFQHEYRQLLMRQGIEFKNKYLWWGPVSSERRRVRGEKMRPGAQMSWRPWRLRA
jgi:hypothetical protein